MCRFWRLGQRLCQYDGWCLRAPVDATRGSGGNAGGKGVICFSLPSISLGHFVGFDSDPPSILFKGRLPPFLSKLAPALVAIETAKVDQMVRRLGDDGLRDRDFLQTHGTGDTCN